MNCACTLAGMGVRLEPRSMTPLPLKEHVHTIPVVNTRLSSGTVCVYYGYVVHTVHT
jgi:hypothetical protein